jgi:hypothetical protein
MAGSEIHVFRDEGGWQDRLRAYKVLIDGAAVGALRRGESQAFRVTPGVHRITVKIDWFETEPVEVQVGDGEKAILRCWPAAGYPMGWALAKRWVGLEVVSAG